MLTGWKICLVAGTLGKGGAERQMFYIVRALKQGGADVRVLCLTSGEYWESRIAELGVPVVWVGKRTSPALRLLKIISEVRSYRPNVVQSQHFYTNPYAAWAARAARVPSIGAIRSDLRSELRTKGLSMCRVCLAGVNMVAANSAAGLQTAKELGVNPRRLALLPNVVDTDEFAPRAEEPAGRTQMIAAGRIVSDKRHDRLLRVMARIRDMASKPIRALVVGSGPLRSAMEKEALRLQLTPDWVEFRGDSADMPASYREAHIAGLTSDYEGTPNVILEAMSAGLPVVAPRTGGIPEIIRDGETGFLVDPNDEAGMARAILQLAETASLRRQMGQCARQFVERNHSPAILLGHLESLYCAACA